MCINMCTNLLPSPYFLSDFHLLRQKLGNGYEAINPQHQACMFVYTENTYHHHAWLYVLKDCVVLYVTCILHDLLIFQLSIDIVETL